MIFGCLLADCLISVNTSLISLDQTGFITDNIILASNIIQDADLSSRKVLLLSLDIHKTFDSVLRTYVEAILAKFGFQGAYMHGFPALYPNS